MNPLVESLVPVFIAGFALQQLLELLDPVVEHLLAPHKAWLMSALALALALTVTLLLGLRVLSPFGITRADWLDAILTALLISSGTKWLNDLLKLISYKKQELKARAARNTPDGGGDTGHGAAGGD